MESGITFVRAKRQSFLKGKAQAEKAAEGRTVVLNRGCGNYIGKASMGFLYPLFAYISVLSFEYCRQEDI